MNDQSFAALPLLPARTPRKIWVELTSKCPLDCIFCSRKTLRGSGGHMPYGLFESLVRQVTDPRAFLLNYSGESTVYPDLIPAIRLARATGAFVELVSALVCAPDAMLRELCESGLGRLTVSVHAVSETKFAEIYRYGSFETLRARLTRFLDLCRTVRHPPIVDLAFVAMDRNLEELSAVAAFAKSLGLRSISIFPVIRRDPIPVRFPEELASSGDPRPDFRAKLLSAAGRAREACPEVTFTVCNPSFTSSDPCLGEVPGPFPGLLPPGGRIHSCEQDPWETMHVLSNGDVVACEVLDKVPLGNIARQSLAQIWDGEGYRRFRERYHRAEVAECRWCPWKKAYRPGPIQSEIIASRGRSAQLLQGWHEPSNEPHVWSSQQAMAVLAPRPGSEVLHLAGLLPPGPPGVANELVVRCHQTEIGTVVNPGQETMPFRRDFAIRNGLEQTWPIEFRTREVYRPSERGTSADRRDLGFALLVLAAKPSVDPDRTARQRAQLRPLANWIRAVDLLGGLIGRFRRRRRPMALSGSPGLSILIPEWDNIAELSACLESLQRALAHWTEPVETIVVVNGSPRFQYRSLQASYPAIRWRFYDRPLGFSGAIAAGLSAAAFDWVYLLNSDVTLDPHALEAAGRCRSPRSFAIASQIVLKDATRFRDETNWTTLFLEDGLVTIHDLIPQSEMPVEGFYAGGGAALFQTRLLRSFLDATAYAPFYWEDVEWGWRARKSGYRVLFCPESVAHHSRRSTIDRHYEPAEVDFVVQRNRLLFQLRNLLAAGSAERAIEEIARSAGRIAEQFRAPRIFWKIALGRLWNHLAADVGQVGNLRRVLTRLAGRPVKNRPQVENLPHTIIFPERPYREWGSTSSSLSRPPE
jgi:MoaA/NifB/PqqE/SkfB family radical SAM enzyme/GT2 family glycosyltransferase